MEKRDNRSNHYQHLFAETACSNEMMEAFSNEFSLYNRLNPFEYNEELMDLEEQLRKEFWRIVETQLTERQKAVIKLCAEGKTQMEIAKMLNVNQSSITKSINGNVDYGKKNDADAENRKTPQKSKVYGGSRKKLRRLLEEDPKVRAILAKMAEVRAEKW